MSRQAPVGRYIVDFLCADRMLIVEVDGGQHAERQEHDGERTRWLQARGYRVVQFWNNDVLHETNAVIAAIVDALNSKG